MHQDPEHSDYDDDEYNYYPQYNDYGYPKEFAINWAAWEEWLSDAIKDIVNEKEMYGYLVVIKIKKKSRNKKNN